MPISSESSGPLVDSGIGETACWLRDRQGGGQIPPRCCQGCASCLSEVRLTDDQRSAQIANEADMQTGRHAGPSECSTGQICRAFPARCKGQVLHPRRQARQHRVLLDGRRALGVELPRHQLHAQDLCQLWVLPADGQRHHTQHLRAGACVRAQHSTAQHSMHKARFLRGRRATSCDKAPA